MLEEERHQGFGFACLAQAGRQGCSVETWPLGRLRKETLKERFGSLGASSCKETAGRPGPELAIQCQPHQHQH